MEFSNPISYKIFISYNYNEILTKIKMKIFNKKPLIKL
ncbi:hypothetical protein K709_0491 [Campylobacter coli HN-CCD07046]|nr:hypothetical protein K709_0491 [Campylobacter coli HN-CCD07046]